MGKDKPILLNNKIKYKYILLCDKKTDTEPNLSAALDTLEITEDNSIDKAGTEKKKLYKRANSKYFTDSYLIHLLNLESPLKKEYWDTWHCNSCLRYDGNSYYGTYCKKRWCVVCARIGTAKRIKTYLPIFKESFNNPYFVTLTQPNVKAENLREEISNITKSFRRILNLHSQTNGRILKKQLDIFISESNNLDKNEIKILRKFSREYLRLMFDYDKEIKGTRNLEITYNPNTDTYHPHLHCVINGKEQAQFLKDNWLKQFPAASEKAQDIRPFGNKDSDLLEAFKYSQKIISQSNGKKYIYASAIDIINLATRGSTGGVRLFQPFGFKQPKNEVDLTAEEETGIKELTSDDDIQTVLYQYNKDIFDWVDTDTGEVLTDYIPSKPMEEIRNNRIIF